MLARILPERDAVGWVSWLGSTAIVLVVALAACRPGYPEPSHPDQPVPDEVPGFISAEEASLFVGHQGVSFVDARPGRLYLAGHAPGAVQVSWKDFVDSEARTMNGRLDADIEAMGRTLGALGVSGEDWIIVFGDPIQLWGEDGRVAWTLLTLGVDRVSVVDGGYPAWQKAGLKVDRGRLERPPLSWTPRLRDDFLARRQDVASFVERAGDWRAVLVDVREPAEYRGGQDAPNHGSVRLGHIPSAVNLPFRSLLDDQGRLLPVDQLEGILIPLGIRPDAEIITYCTGGVRSAHSWYVLHSLGYPRVRSYAGSLWEWAVDRRLPMERGGARAIPPAPPWPPPARSVSGEAGP